MKQKHTWIDTYLDKYKWYRKLRKGYWYKHRFTLLGHQLRLNDRRDWWARYGEVNAFSSVIEQEIY